MGLFQRPSSHRGQPLSERKHFQNHYANNDFNNENSNSSKKPPSGHKRRGLLGGLIRGRKEMSSRQTLLTPPSPPHNYNHEPIMQARSPTQIQSVALPTPVQHELRQKLQEAHQIEAFLNQAGIYKPTVGGSDIEFLFNNVATPTAAAAAVADHYNESDQRRLARQKAGNLIGRVDALLGASNNSTTASTSESGSISVPYDFVHPQSPFRQHTQLQQRIQIHRVGSVQSSHQDAESLNTPQHIGSKHPQAFQSARDSDASMKKAKKGKKKGKRGLFSSRKEREWGAFESEETYYQGMQALEEGRQFQKVSNAFKQHFKGKENKSQSSGKGENLKKKNKDQGGLGKDSQKEENYDDNTTSETLENNIASSVQEIAPPRQGQLLKGILRTNGRFGGPMSVKSGNTSVANDETGYSEGKRCSDEKSEAGGYDLYKSASSDEMFVGIRSSDDSESTGLYTDENELIELRSALDSNSGSTGEQNEDNQDDVKRLSQSHVWKENNRIVNTPDGSSDYQQVFSSPPTAQEQEMTDANERSQFQHQKRNSSPPIGPGKHSDPSPRVDGKRLQKSQEEGLEHSVSSNSDSYKSIQDRFADMIQSVGTFHETQNQKIEEAKQSFLSALSATPVAKNTSVSPKEDLVKTPQHINSEAEKQIVQHHEHQKIMPKISTSLTCSSQSELATESLDEQDEISKQDELYRQLMSAPSGEHVIAAANFIKEQSNSGALSTTNRFLPPQFANADKNAEYFQAKRVFQREENTRLMIRPQFGDQSEQLIRTRYEEDLSLTEAMDSTNIEEVQDFHEQWELAKEQQEQETRALIARTQISTTHPSLSPAGYQERATPKRQTSPHLSTELVDTYQAFDDPPAIGRGLSIAENPQLNGLLFSHECKYEDDSLLQDPLLQAHAHPNMPQINHSKVRSYVDAYVPPIRPALSMARSRQLSLVDSASTDEGISIVADEKGDGNAIQESQIGDLLNRLETVERRKKLARGESQNYGQEDPSIAEEINAIKSILQGLKLENERTSHEKERVRERDEFSSIHSSGESATSTGFVKAESASPNSPPEGSQTATPRTIGGEFHAQKISQKLRTAPRQLYGNTRPTYFKDDSVSISATGRGCHTEPSRSLRKAADYALHDPEQFSNDGSYGRPYQNETQYRQPYEEGIEWTTGWTNSSPIIDEVEYDNKAQAIDEFRQDNQLGPQYDCPDDRRQPHYPRTSSQMLCDPPYHQTNGDTQGHVVYSAPAHHNEAAPMPQHSDDDFFYSRTESDITTSIALDPSLIGARQPNNGPRQCKSHRAATYFDTLSAGVKAVGSFDSISDRNSLSTDSKKSTVNHSRKKASENSTLGSAEVERSFDGGQTKNKAKLREEPKRKEAPGIKEKIFRSARDRIEKMEKNGEISERNKARVLRFMHPLVGNSSDDESTHSQEEEDDEPHTLQSYLPSCHFFCG